MRSDIDFVSRHRSRVRSSLALAGAGTLLVLSPHPAHAASAPSGAAARPAPAAGALGLLVASAPRTLSLDTPMGDLSLWIGLDPLSSCGCGLSLKAHLAPAGSRKHTNPSSLNGSLPGRAPAVPVPSGGAVSSCGCAGHSGTGAVTAVVVQVDVTAGLGAGSGTSACGCPASGTTGPSARHHRKPNGRPEGSPGGGTTPASGGPTPASGGTTPAAVPATPAAVPATPAAVPATPAAVPATPAAVPAAVTAAEPSGGLGEGLAYTGSPLLPGLAGLLILGIGGLLEWRRRAAQ